MKGMPGCRECMLRRNEKVLGVMCLSSAKEWKARKAVQALIRKKFKPGINPSWLGTLQALEGMRTSGVADPFKEKKKEVIALAKKCYPNFEKYVESAKGEYEMFRRAALVAICGNTIEISAGQHRVDINELEKEMRGAIRKGLYKDGLRKVFEKLKRAKSVVYLCDNCGEAVFDELLLWEIGKYAKVKIGVASAPVDDDLTVREVKKIGLHKYGKIIKKGQSFGVIRQWAPKSTWKALDEADIIFAKGMANYETLTEYPKIVRKTAFLLKVKCDTVSRRIRAPIGAHIAKYRGR